MVLKAGFWRDARREDGGSQLARRVAAPSGQPTSFGGLIRAIGMLEVVGGVIGFATVTWLYLGGHQGGIPGGDVQLALLPFGALTTGGIALLRSRRVGLWLSLVMQVCQAVAWTAGRMTWRFSAGPFLSVTLLAEKTSIFAGWDTSFGFGQVPDATPDLLSLNLIPAVIAFVLWRQLRAPKPATSPPAEQHRLSRGGGVGQV